MSPSTLHAASSSAGAKHGRFAIFSRSLLMAPRRTEGAQTVEERPRSASLESHLRGSNQVSPRTEFYISVAIVLRQPVNSGSTPAVVTTSYRCSVITSLDYSRDYYFGAGKNDLSQTSFKSSQRLTCSVIRANILILFGGNSRLYSRITLVTPGPAFAGLAFDLRQNPLQ